MQRDKVEVMIKVGNWKMVMNLVAKEAKGGFVIVYTNKDHVKAIANKLGGIPVGDTQVVVKLDRNFAEAYYTLSAIFELANKQPFRASVYATRRKEMIKVLEFEYWSEAEA